ncbi:hypothetical protein CRENBAI_024843, partial [Crenichthys baileyi]
MEKSTFLDHGVWRSRELRLLPGTVRRGDGANYRNAASLCALPAAVKGEQTEIT